MKNKIVILTIIILIILVYSFFYLATPQQTITTNSTNGLIFPDTGKYYLVNIHNQSSPSGYTWYLSNTENDKFEILPEIPNDSSPLISESSNVFSPDGTKIVYKKENDLIIYNINNKKNTTIKIDTKYRFIPYNPTELMWLDDHTIGYYCPIEIKGPDKYTPSTYKPRWCGIDTNSSITKTYLQRTIINTWPKSGGYDKYSCVYNFDNTLCLMIKPHIRILEAHLFYDIIYKNGSSYKTIIRSWARPNSLYWSNDNHVYVELVSGKGIIKSKI